MPTRRRAGGCASRMNGSPRKPRAGPSSIRLNPGRCAGAAEQFPMTDLSALETELLTAITAATDEAALETVRVSALGRNGSISALLKTLGTMTPDERKQQGAAINGVKDRVTASLTARKDALKELALDQRLNTEAVDVTLPVREPP